MDKNYFFQPCLIIELFCSETPLDTQETLGSWIGFFFFFFFPEENKFEVMGILSHALIAISSKCYLVTLKEIPLLYFTHIIEKEQRLRNLR